jgi:hypothetical protein
MGICGQDTEEKEEENENVSPNPLENQNHFMKKRKIDLI